MSTGISNSINSDPRPLIPHAFNDPANSRYKLHQQRQGSSPGHVTDFHMQLGCVLTMTNSNQKTKNKTASAKQRNREQTRNKPEVQGKDMKKCPPEKILPIQATKQTQPIAIDSKSDDPMSKYEGFTSAPHWR